MKVLYAAIDQRVPGTDGGAVHVAAVATGLASRGHEVHVLTAQGSGRQPDSAHWHAMRPPLGVRQLRLLQTPRIVRLACELCPEVVIERYYNFGGEGILAARAVGALTVLEVNAPVIDYPGSKKQLLDRLLLVEPMRRWRYWQCAHADLIVTPTATILPPWVDPDAVVELEWGADTKRFHPGAIGPVPFDRQPGEIVVVFAGAFRPWHGAINLVQAIRELRRRGQQRVRAVFIGHGPLLQSVRHAARNIQGIEFTGRIPHEQMPSALAAADVGVAPFDVAAHPPLRLGFYWSPLKLFEYMASGLPVVAPRIERLSRLVEHDREGLLYDPGDPTALADALERMTNARYRSRLGTAARDRAEAAFGWDSHCRALDRAITAARMRRAHSADQADAPRVGHPDG